MDKLRTLPNTTCKNYPDQSHLLGNYLVGDFNISDGYFGLARKVEAIH